MIWLFFPHKQHFPFSEKKQVQSLPVTAMPIVCQKPGFLKQTKTFVSKQGFSLDSVACYTRALHLQSWDRFQLGGDQGNHRLLLAASFESYLWSCKPALIKLVPRAHQSPWFKINPLLSHPGRAGRWLIASLEQVLDSNSLRLTSGN